MEEGKILILNMIAFPHFSYLGCGTSYENDYDVNSNYTSAYEIK